MSKRRRKFLTDSAQAIGQQLIWHDANNQRDIETAFTTFVQRGARCQTAPLKTRTAHSAGFPRDMSDASENGQAQNRIYPSASPGTIRRWADDT